MCDVGQGDAFLIIDGYFQVLIDAGPEETAVLECLEEQLPPWDRKVEIVVVTHPDLDHFGGLEGVMLAYEVDEVWITPLNKKSADFSSLKQSLLSKTGLKVWWPETKLKRKLTKNVFITSLYPSRAVLEQRIGQKIETETQLSDFDFINPALNTDVNDLSIVLLVEFKKRSILLTGDAGVGVEQALIEQDLLGKLDVLKVSHHGSKTGTSEAFIQRVRPELALISCSKNNTYGHPDPSVVNRLITSGSRVFRTDLLGTVEVNLR